MKLAIVEDEPKLAASLKEGLEGEGYDVTVHGDGESLLRSAQRTPFPYALLVLDLMLPGKSGFEVCKELREQGVTIPILVLTARDAVEDKVKALDSGADDFLTKPFVFDELLARVRALVRRSGGFRSLLVEIQNLKVDKESRRVWRGSKEVSLTPTEFDLLLLLIDAKGKPRSREEISSELWDLRDSAFSNVVDVHVSNLRKKIDDERDKRIIRTVRGMGYAIAP